MPFWNKKKSFLYHSDIKILLECFFEGGIVLDKNHKILYLNKGCEKIFGYLADELIGQHINILVPFRLREKHTHAINNIPHSIFINKLMVPPDRRIMGLTKENKEIPLEIRLNSLKIDSSDFILAIILDKTVENKLQDNLEEYKEFFEDSLDMLCMVNDDGYFVDINAAFIEILGYTKDELFKKPLFNLIHPDDLEETKEEIKNLVDGKKTFQFKNRYRKKDGTYIWLSWSAIKTKNYIIGIARDITKEKLILAELEKKESLLSHTEILTNVGTWDWNTTTGELFWSQGTKRMFEVDEETLENFFKSVHPEDVDFVKEALDKAVKEKLSYNLEYRIITLKTKELKYVKVTGNFIQELDDLHLSGAIMDKTKDRNIQEALKLVAEKAKEASLMKSMFVANMSHEIRTPLNGIIGMTNILKEYELDKQIKECVESINFSSGVLLSLINKILDFSKIESGKMDINLQDFDFNEFIEKIKHNFEMLCKNNDNVQFMVRIKDSIMNIKSDKMKLNQILYNLIGNAIKFTNEGFILLEVKKETLYDKDFIKFTIKDTGVGIEDNIQKKLFLPFVQGDSSTTKEFSGTGLGLSISKNLVELLGGKITLESKVGLGTTISFVIPSNIDKHSEIENRNLDKSILIAEDNNINQIVVKKILEKLGHKHIQIYSDGQSIYEALKNKTVSAELIFMDIHMPRMNGIEATKKIRELGINVPIIAITANAMDGIREECYEAGMNDFLLKPFQKSDIEKIISTWLVQII